MTLKLGVIADDYTGATDISVALLKEGIGWGNMPRPMVIEDIERGTLVELDLPEKTGAIYSLSALWRRDTRLGPASNWLIDAMRERLAACPA